MNNNLIIFISVLAVFNLSLMSVYSWTKHRKSPAYFWLGFMFFSVAVAILNNITIFTQNENIWLYHLSIFLNISWGTYMIQFIRSINPNPPKPHLNKWQIFAAVFYLPFLILMIIRPEIGSDTLSLAQKGLMNNYSLIFNIFIITYSVGANIYLIIGEYRTKAGDCITASFKKTRKEMLWLMFGLQLLAFFPFMLKLDLIYIISYMPIFGQIFYIYIFFKINKTDFLTIQQDKLPTSNNSISKYASLKISDQQSENICCRITSHMHNKKPFIQAEYSLSDLSGELNIPANVLSMIINSRMNKSFPDYINSLRIEEAILLLNDKQKSKLTIEAIAYDCGFNNRTSFYDAFKKHTGKLPSVYLNTKRGADSLVETPPVAR